MKMATCIECNRQLRSIHGLFCHLDLEHPDLSPYLFQCGEANCFRHFNTRNSLQKHLLHAHHIPLDFDEIEVLPPQANIAKNNELNEASFAKQVRIDSIEDNLQDISIEDFAEALTVDATEMTSKIYGKRRLPLNAAQSLVDDFTKFLGGSHLSILKSKVKNALSQPHCSPEEIISIMAMFEKLENPFDDLRTEYKRLKFLSEEGYYIEPTKYRIGRSFGTVRRKKELKAAMVQFHGQFIPFRWVLKKFFELPDALSSTLTHMNNLMRMARSRPDFLIIQNLIQCSHWIQKRSKYREDDIVIPLCASGDDVDVNNPLGAHSGKVGTMYISIPCLPPEVCSQIDNLFLILIYETWMRQGKLRETYQPVIDEFTFLETQGIEINTVEGPKKVYFVLAALQGDNLGLNGMLGMVESFSANRYCRFCKMQKADCRTSLRVPHKLLRTIDSYEMDFSSKERMQEYGLKERCPFNDIPSFHAMDNPIVDEMHDFREGVAAFDMKDILNGLTDGPHQAFDLEVFNERLRMFDFGPIDGRNTPNLIRAVDLTNDKKLRMSAAEMTRFVMRFGVLVGDLVAAENPYWKLYLLLRQIFDFILAKKITTDDIAAFRSLIIRHHQICGRIYKPKDHFCLHYCDAAKKIGPLVHVSSMRHESKHTHMTAPASASLSRVNIAYSLAKREQLALAYRFLKNKSILPPVKTNNNMKLIHADQIDCYLPLQLRKHDVLKSPSWVEYKGTLFEPKMALIVGTEDLSPTFVEIKTILMHDGLQDPFFVCSCLHNLGFDEHKWAFEIEKTNEKVCISITSLFDPLPVTIHTAPTGDLYIGLRYAV